MFRFVYYSGERQYICGFRAAGNSVQVFKVLEEPDLHVLPLDSSAPGVTEDLS